MRAEKDSRVGPADMADQTRTEYVVRAFKIRLTNQVEVSPTHHRFRQGEVTHMARVLILSRLTDNTPARIYSTERQFISVEGIRSSSFMTPL